MKLYLLPNLLDPLSSKEYCFPPILEKIVPGLMGLIAESPKSAYAYLKLFTFIAPRTFRDVPIWILNEHTSTKEIEEFSEDKLNKGPWGLISDAGLPCLADPGAKLVMRARSLGVEIEALSGPSSIVLALMLSGLPGQSFSFHGYLEKDKDLQKAQIKRLEERSFKEKSTQIFIEAPYRNQKLLETLLHTLFDNTLLCIAFDLTSKDQEVITMPIYQWKKNPLPLIDKKPAVFLFSRAPLM